METFRPGSLNGSSSVHPSTPRTSRRVRQTKGLVLGSRIRSLNFYDNNRVATLNRKMDYRFIITVKILDLQLYIRGTTVTVSIRTSRRLSFARYCN